MLTETIRSTCRHWAGRTLRFAKVLLTSRVIRVRGWDGFSRFEDTVPLEDVDHAKREYGRGPANLALHFWNDRVLRLHVSAPGVWKMEVNHRARLAREAALENNAASLPTGDDVERVPGVAIVDSDVDRVFFEHELRYVAPADESAQVEDVPLFESDLLDLEADVLSAGASDVTEPDVPEAEAEPLEVDAELPDVEVDAELPDAELDAELSNVEIEAELSDVEIEAELPDVENEAELSDVELEAELPDVELDAELPDVEVDAELPDVEIEAELPDVELEAELSNVEMEAELPDVEVEAELPDVEVEAELPDVEVEAELPDVEVEAELPDVELEAELPDVEVEAELPDVEVEAELPDVEVEAELPDVEVEAELPDVELEAELPDVEPEAELPDVEIEAELPEVEVEAELPDVELEADLVDDASVATGMTAIGEDVINADLLRSEPEAADTVSSWLEGEDPDGRGITIDSGTLELDPQAPDQPVPSRPFFLTEVYRGHPLADSGAREKRGPAVEDSSSQGAEEAAATLSDTVGSEAEPATPAVDVPDAPDVELEADIPSVDLETDPLDVELEADIPSVDLETDPLDVELEADIPSVDLETDPLDVELEADIPSAKLEADLPEVELEADLPDVELEADLPEVELEADLPDVELEADLSDVKLKADLPAVELGADPPDGKSATDLPLMERPGYARPRESVQLDSAEGSRRRTWPRRFNLHPLTLAEILRDIEIAGTADPEWRPIGQLADQPID